MPDSSDAFRDVVHALTETHEVGLTPAAMQACREIFDLTVANFARQAADRAVTEHPWANSEFRAFILGQVRRIATMAKERANGEPVSPEVLRSAARDVMHRTHQVCRVAAEEGRLRFTVLDVPDRLEGGICDAYLQESAY